MHDEWQERPKYLEAYQRARTATGDDDAIAARVAGYLFVELFNRRSILTEEPCRQLSKELLSKDREGGGADDTVFNVGNHYRNHFVRLCKSHCFYTSHPIRNLRFFAVRTTSTAYPTPSKHPSSPSFDSLQEMTKAGVPTRFCLPPLTPGQVLRRDGYRCLLTGCFDETSLELYPHLAKECDSLGAIAVAIDACHILSESTVQGVDPTGDSKDGRVVAKVWAIPLPSLSSPLLTTKDPDGLRHQCHDHS